MCRPERKGARAARLCRRPARRQRRACRDRGRAAAVSLRGAGRDREAGAVRRDGAAAGRLRPRGRSPTCAICGLSMRAGERVPFALLDPTPAPAPQRAAARGDALSLAAAAGRQRRLAVAGGSHGRRRPDHGAALCRRRAVDDERAARLAGLAARSRRARAGRAGAAAPAAALVRPGRVLGRVRDRDQCRPAQLASLHRAAR